MTIHALLRKAAMGAPYDYACALLEIEGPLRKRVIEWAKTKVPDEDIYTDDLIKGREDEPHITVKWGLEAGSKQKVAKVVKAFGPVEAKLGQTKIFDSPPKYDVVVAEVDSDDIRRLNALIRKNIKNTTTYPFTPHMTLAYVKKGSGKKYAGRKDFEGEKLTFKSLHYASKNGKKIPVSLVEKVVKKSLTLLLPDGRRGELAADAFAWSSAHVLVKAIAGHKLAALYKQGARWITLRETRQHVLIMPVGDHFRVIAGAGGALEHLKLTNIKTVKEAEADAFLKRIEKKKSERERQARMTEKQIKAEHEKAKSIKEITGRLKKERREALAKITGVSEALTNAEKKAVEGQVDKKAEREKLPPKERVKVLKEALADAEKVKKREAQRDKQDLIAKARDIIAQNLTKSVLEDLPVPDGEKVVEANKQGAPWSDEGEPIVRPEDAWFVERPTQIKLTTEQAEEIWRTNKQFEAKLKEVRKLRPKLDAKLTDLDVLGVEISDDDIRRAALEEHIEAARATMNAQFYSKIQAFDHGTEMFKQQVKGGVVALNGMASEVLGESLVTDSLVQDIGVSAASQMVAHKIWEAGLQDEMLKGMKEDIVEGNIKVVESALKIAGEMQDRHDAIRSLSEETGGQFSKLSASAQNLSNSRQAIKHLGLASGSLEASASLLYALMREPRDVIRVDVGTSALSAKARAERLGLSASDYRIDRMATGRYRLEIKEKAYDKMLSVSRSQQYENDAVLTSIKKHERNVDGWTPAGIAKRNPTTGKTTQLSDAQQSGIRFVMEKMKRAEGTESKSSGAILDFKPGTGKTLMAIGMAGQAIADGHTERAVIAVPSRLLGEFRDQLKQWGDGSFKAAILDVGKKDAMRKAINDPSNQIVVVGEDSLRAQAMTPSKANKYLEERRQAYLGQGENEVNASSKAHADLKAMQGDNSVTGAINRAGGFNFAIVDEAHEMFNKEPVLKGETNASVSQRSKMLHKLKAKHRVAMTGTVVRSALDNFISMAEWAKPGSLDRKAFLDKWKSVNQGTTMFQRSSVEAFRQELASNLYTQDIKRVAKVKNHDVRVSLSPEQVKAFGKVEESRAFIRSRTKNKRKRNALALKSYAEHQKTILDRNYKTNALIQNITKTTAPLLSSGKQGVYIAYNKMSLDTLQKSLKSKFKERGAVVRFTGDETPKEREAIKKRFREGKVKALLGTHATIATGHNLQSASFLVNVDVPHTAADMMQRVRRIDRKGQTKDVDIYNYSTATPQAFRAEDKLFTGQRTLGSFGNPADLDESGIGRYLQAARMIQKERKVA